MKEITYSEGPTVRYQRRHYVYGIGTIHSNKEFSGLAIFDPFIRMLIFPIVLFGVVNVSLDVFDAVVFASLFYLLILFLSSEDDNTLLDQCKSMFEAKH